MTARKPGVSLSIYAECRYNGTSVPCHLAYLDSYSAGIASGYLIPVGTSVTVILSLQGRKKKLELKGVVTRSENNWALFQLDNRKPLSSVIINSLARNFDNTGEKQLPQQFNIY